MRYDKLILKATLTLALTWLLIQAGEQIIEHVGVKWYWRRFNQGHK